MSSLRFLGFLFAQLLLLAQQSGVFGLTPQLTNLNVKCDETGMRVTVDFDAPFNGIIFSKGFFSDYNCRFVEASRGRGNQTKHSFKIPLKGCGTSKVNIDIEDESIDVKGFENVIVVQNNAKYQAINDSVRMIVCRYTESQATSNAAVTDSRQVDKRKVLFKPFTVDMLDVITVPMPDVKEPEHQVTCWMDITRGVFPSSIPIEGPVKVGENLTMTIYIKDGKEMTDLRVKDCYAYDSRDDAVQGGQPIIKLTTDQGCPLNPKLIDFWKTTAETGTSGATVMAHTTISAFKFPERENVFLSCNVELCTNGCLTFCNEDNSSSLVPSTFDPSSNNLVISSGNVPSGINNRSLTTNMMTASKASTFTTPRPGILLENKTREREETSPAPQKNDRRNASRNKNLEIEEDENEDDDVDILTEDEGPFAVFGGMDLSRLIYQATESPPFKAAVEFDDDAPNDLIDSSSSLPLQAETTTMNPTTNSGDSSTTQESASSTSTSEDSSSEFVTSSSSTSSPDEDSDEKSSSREVTTNPAQTTTTSSSAAFTGSTTTVSPSNNVTTRTEGAESTTENDANNNTEVGFEEDSKSLAETFRGGKDNPSKKSTSPAKFEGTGKTSTSRTRGASKAPERKPANIETEDATVEQVDVPSIRNLEGVKGGSGVKGGRGSTKGGKQEAGSGSLSSSGRRVPSFLPRSRRLKVEADQHDSRDFISSSTRGGSSNNRRLRASSGTSSEPEGRRRKKSSRSRSNSRRSHKSESEIRRRKNSRSGSPRRRSQVRTWRLEPLPDSLDLGYSDIPVRASRLSHRVVRPPARTSAIITNRSAHSFK